MITVNTNKNVPMASPKKAEATGTVGVTEFKPTLNGATAPVVEKVPVRYIIKGTVSLFRL